MSELMTLLFDVEKCLSYNNADNFLLAFKKLTNCGSECKKTLVSHRGITFYIPKKTKNASSNKSILIVIHELSRTGAPVVAVDTAKTLVKNGYFVTVVAMRRGALLKDLLDYGIPVVFDREIALMHDCNALLGSKNANFCIDTFLSAFDKTIIVTAVLVNLIRRYSSNKEIIWWLHEGSATYDGMGNLMPRRLKPSIRVCTGGQYALDQLHKYGLGYDAEILNYGVNDLYDSVIENNNKTNTTVKFILPGSIGDRKGQKILVDAINKLPSSYLNKSEFLFIGDIVSEADINGKKIKNQLIKITKTFSNVEYVPSVTREKLFDLYKGMDVLVLPSLDDPMPVVATEALMLEKVVLCSKNTGTSYYLNDGENGFTFETNSSDALCAKIEYIVDHRAELAKIGQNGRNVYLQNFEMGIFEKKLLYIVEGGAK